MRSLLGALSLLLPVVLLAGCGLGDSLGSSEGSAGGRSSQSDPQVLGDVVDYALMLPGEAQIRAIRVSNFSRSLIYRECGLQGPTLDDTSGRFMQQTFPDLALIRAKGLVEPEAAYESEVPSEPDSKRCENATKTVGAQLPSRGAVAALDEPWLDVVESVEQRPEFVELRATMLDCMTSRTSLEIGNNVPVDFLLAVNVRNSVDATDDEMDQWSTVYADCSEDYFDLLRSDLESRRPSLVERNREVLQAYASELIAAGYTP